MVAGGKELDLVEEIGRKSSEFRRLFHDELLPAFRRGDRERALGVHHHSEELLAARGPRAPGAAHRSGHCRATAPGVSSAAERRRRNRAG